MAKLPNVALKTIVLVDLSRVKEKALLEEDLCWIGCHGLMERPWSLKHESIVAELLVEQDNQWKGMVRQDMEKWTSGAWWKVYSFSRNGKGMATRSEKYCEGKFSNLINSKDGFAILECIDVKTR